MPLPAAVGYGLTALGAIGSLFGSSREMSPEAKAVYDRLQMMAEQGYSPQAIARMRQQLLRSLGSEAGALSAVTTRRLGQQGAGGAATNVALNRLNQQRLNALGRGIADIDIASEQQKFSALQAMGQIAGGAQYEERGGGFGQLFGAGLNYLMNQPQGGFDPFFEEKYNAINRRVYESGQQGMRMIQQQQAPTGLGPYRRQ